MASGVSVPNCASCQNPYKYGGPTPYLLPCLHSVCENCLQSDVDDTVVCTTCNEYFIKIQNNFPKSCHGCLSYAEACVACSECSQAQLTHINPFPRDDVTAKTTFLSNAEHFASELLCTNRDDGNQAMSWCEICEAFPHARNQEAFIYFSRGNLKGLQEAIDGFGGFYTRLKDVAVNTLEKEHVSISKTALADLREKEDALQKQVACLQENITLQQETLRTERLQGAVPKELTLIFIDSSNTRPDTEVKLSCFTLDQQKANRAKVFFTKENKMARRPVNLDLKKEKLGEKEISKFFGTTSTKSLTSIYSEYWEVHTNVNLHQVLTGNKLIMETGICIENDIDVKSKVGREPGSVVLYVTQCETHKRICVRARKGAGGSKCYQQPLSNTTDTDGKLMYGILTNPHKNQCIFFDLNSERILCSFENVVFDKVLWPVFAVFHRPYATVELSCVSGDKIQMDKTKRDLILSALS